MTELQQNEIEQAFAAHAERLAAMTFPDALGSGDRAPNFELPNQYGINVRLTSRLAGGPVVLVFYRGGWCPYCNTQLRGFREALPKITSLGATLVAISPQLPDASAAFVEEAGLDFEVLSDVGAHMASKYGIAFHFPEIDRELFLSVGNDLSKVNGSDTWTLVAPSTFLIAADGLIEYARVDANHTVRPQVAEVISILEAISSR